MIRMTAMKTTVLGALLTLLLACGTTVERQEQRYKRATDQISVVLAKKPMMRTAVEAKLKSFQAEHATIMKGADEEAKKTSLARLNSRMEEYAQTIDPTLKAKKTAAKTSKLGKKVVGSTVTSGKLGAATAGTALAQPLVKPASTAASLAKPVVNKLGGMAQPTATKLGGALGPKPTTKLGGAGIAPAPVPSKLGGTKLGGTGKLGGTPAPSKLGGTKQP